MSLHVLLDRVIDYLDLTLTRQEAHRSGQLVRQPEDYSRKSCFPSSDDLVAAWEPGAPTSEHS